MNAALAWSSMSGAGRSDVGLAGSRENHYATTRHRAIDVARRNGPHATRRASDEGLHSVPAPGSVADQVAGDAQARDLRLLLGELPDAQREVITLAFYGELTHSEIAAQLDLPAGTVRGGCASACKNYDATSTPSPSRPHRQTVPAEHRSPRIDTRRPATGSVAKQPLTLTFGPTPVGPGPKRS